MALLNKILYIYKLLIKNNMMKKWLITQTIKKMFGSRKFLYTVIGVIVQILHDTIGLDPVETQNILMSIAALVLGQGVADMKK
tara:strand:- start:364 stop:612 length:249 start_codon:yes stop_codon:yes gene_type:complete